MNRATRSEQDSSSQAAVHVAFELSKNSWKLAFSDGKERRVRVVTVAARDLAAVEEQIRLAGRRFGLRGPGTVYSCYEAGRDGFWLHRALVERGIDNIVVDPASIEVNRRSRRAKTDRLDATKLVLQLVRYRQGERRVWAVVRVPSAQEEDARQLHRELAVLKKERRQHRVRIQSLLFAQGIDQKVQRNFVALLDGLRCWEGSPLPAAVKARIVREYQRLQQVEQQIRELEHERREQIRSNATEATRKVKQMAELKGIGFSSAWLLVMELFAWRQFKNRRELAAAVGLSPTPYQSGRHAGELGISKSGNKRVRTLMVELAWAWLRFQPDSALAQWYQQRFGQVVLGCDASVSSHSRVDC